MAEADGPLLEFTSGLKLIRAIQREKETLVFGAGEAKLEGFRVELDYDYPELLAAAEGEKEHASLNVEIPEGGTYFPGLVMLGGGDSAELLAGEELLGRVKGSESRHLRLYFRSQPVTLVKGRTLMLRISRPDSLCRIECLLLMKDKPGPEAGKGTNQQLPAKARTSKGREDDPQFSYMGLARFFFPGLKLEIQDWDEGDGSLDIMSAEKTVGDLLERDYAPLLDYARVLGGLCHRADRADDSETLRLMQSVAEALLDRQDERGGWPHFLRPEDCSHSPPHRGNTAEEIMALLSALTSYQEQIDDDRVLLAIEAAASYASRELLLRDGRIQGSSCPESGLAKPGMIIEGLVCGYELTGRATLGQAALEALRAALEENGRIPRELERGWIWQRVGRVMANAWRITHGDPVEFLVELREGGHKVLRLDGEKGCEFFVRDSRGEELAVVMMNAKNVRFLDVQTEGPGPIRVRVQGGGGSGVWADSERVVLDITKGIRVAGGQRRSFCFRTPERGGLIEWWFKGFIPGKHVVTVWDQAEQEVARCSWDVKEHSSDVPIRLFLSPEQGGRMWSIRIDVPGDVAMRVEGAPGYISVFPRLWFSPAIQGK